LWRSAIFCDAVFRTRKNPERDQQKWNPVLRPIALQNIEVAHDLIAKPRTLWRIMRNGLSTLKIRVKRRLSFWWHRPAVSFLM
jgi:hypothetical protein